MNHHDNHQVEMRGILVKSYWVHFKYFINCRTMQPNHFMNRPRQHFESIFFGTLHVCEHLFPLLKNARDVHISSYAGNSTESYNLFINTLTT